MNAGLLRRWHATCGRPDDLCPAEPCRTRSRAARAASGSTAMSPAPTGPRVSNAARFAARPLSEGGTPTHVWLSAQQHLPLLDLTECREIVVVAAHPDDETLGFGAAAAMLADMDVHVQVVSASDGGASHGDLSRLERHRLERVRRAELHRAVNALGLPDPISLGLPDGQLSDREHRVADLLTDILAARPAGTWCAA